MVSDTAPLPLVTLHKRGAIGLNRTAADVLLAGRKEAIKVSLAWDRPGMRLTIRAAADGEPRPHILRVYRRHRDSTMYLIVAQRFFKSSKMLRVRSAQRFMAQVEDETLVVDRAAPSTSAARPELTRPRVRHR